MSEYGFKVTVNASTAEQAVLAMAQSGLVWSIPPGDQYDELVEACDVFYREQRLECGHDVALAVGTRLWCYYDYSFGVLTAVNSDGWHDFVLDGSPYKPAGSRGYYDASRLACVLCGLEQVSRSDHVALGDEWQLVSP